MFFRFETSNGQLTLTLIAKDKAGILNPQVCVMPDFKTYYRIIRVKTARYLCKLAQRSMKQNRDLRKPGQSDHQLSLSKGGKNNAHWRKDNFQ